MLCSRYSDSLRAERSGDRIPMVARFFRTYPDQSWDPPSLLHNGYRNFTGGKADGTWRWPPTPSSAEVQERVELCLYSPFGFSWPVQGWTLPLPLCVQVPASPLQFAASKEEGRVQERRLQCGARQRGQETATLPARHLHYACRRTVEMDSSCVRPQLLALLAYVRYYLVADCIFTRRL